MPLVTIARNGFLESIRQPVYVVVVLAGILALVLNVNLAAFSLGKDDKLLASNLAVADGPGCAVRVRRHARRDHGRRLRQQP